MRFSWRESWCSFYSSLNQFHPSEMDIEEAIGYQCDAAAMTKSITVRKRNPDPIQPGKHSKPFDSRDFPVGICFVDADGSASANASHWERAADLHLAGRQSVLLRAQDPSRNPFLSVFLPSAVQPKCRQAVARCHRQEQPNLLPVLPA